MAQKRKSVDEPILPPNLVVSREEAMTRIQDRIDKGKLLHSLHLQNQHELDEAEKEKDKWSAYNFELLQRLFDNSLIAKEYNNIYGFTVIKDSYNYSLRDEIKDFRESIEMKLNNLESIHERLDLIPEINSSKPNSPAQTTQSMSIQSTKNVFVVHGQDEGTKETLARCLTRMNLNPIILHEQANEGKTIIEKFESHASNVGYAVVLMTPDDVGHIKDKPEQAKPRARQNVIFELGYFIGKLSRTRVCALYKEGVEIPSDYQGVIFIPMDNGGVWRFLLAKELKSVGYSIDMNLI